MVATTRAIIDPGVATVTARFEGSTAELLERDDIVRAVFLEGASKTNGTSTRPDWRNGRPICGTQPLYETHVWRRRPSNI